MSQSPPILVVWDGQSFKPSNGAMRKRCEEFFASGETYRIEFREERSDRSHKHYFATINEMWKNLPEHMHNEFPSPDDLRGDALIRSGYADHVDIAIGDEGLAKRIADMIERLRRRLFSTYAIIVPRGTVVRIWTPKSQSKRGMDGPTFQASKTAVLNFLQDTTGIPHAAAAANAQDDRPPRERNAPRLDPDPPAPEQREPPMRHPPQADPIEPAAETPPPPQPGASTAQASPELAFPASGATSDAKGPEGKAGGGGEQYGQQQGYHGHSADLPRTYSELVAYVKAWTGYVKDPKRFAERVEKEKRMLWPTIHPPLTAGQINHVTSLLDDRAARL